MYPAHNRITPGNYNGRMVNIIIQVGIFYVSRVHGQCERVGIYIYISRPHYAPYPRLLPVAYKFRGACGST